MLNDNSSSLEIKRKTANSAPAGNQTPTLLKTTKTTTTPSKNDPSVTSSFASASPTEKSRCADGFNPDERRTMARFSNDTSGPSQQQSMKILLDRDRSSTSMLVAELRRDAARMRKNEEREKNLAREQESTMRKKKQQMVLQEQEEKESGAAASSSSSPFDDFDESQLGRFASLASSARNKAVSIEVSRRVGKEEEAERVLLNAEQEEEWIMVSRTVLAMMIKVVNHNSEEEVEEKEEESSSPSSSNEKSERSRVVITEDEEDKDEDDNQRIHHQEQSLRQQQNQLYSNLSSLITKNEAGEDMISIMNQKKDTQEDKKKKAVTFSHLSTRRAGKMTQDVAAVVIQRQMRRY